MRDRTIRRALLALLGAVALPLSAAAQSFAPQSFTGNRTVTLEIDDDELIHDRDGSSGSGAPHPRYSPNLNHRRRLLANPFATSVSIEFDKIQLNETVVGGSRDFLELGWYGDSPVGQRSGVMWSPGTTWAVPTANSRSMKHPGVLFRFRSGPTAPSASAYVESEQSGFSTSKIKLIGNGTAGNNSVPSLAVFERVTAVLLADDDIVLARLPAFGNPVTVAAWQQTASTGVKLWARCNAAPTAAAFDKSSSTSTTSGKQGAFLELNSTCAGVWYVALTNTNSSAQVVHLTFGTHYPGRVYQAPQERVGFAYNASATEIADTKAAFQEAAWRLYAATGGGYMLKSYEFYDDTDCLTALAQKCDGGICRFCIKPPEMPCTVSTANGLGQVFVCNGHKTNPKLLTHEMGHVYIGLRDNYHVANPGCPAATSSSGYTFDLCAHSIMSTQGRDNRNVFCTALGHRTNTEDWREHSSLDPNFKPSYIQGPISYDCNGGSYWTNNGDEWGALNIAHVPTVHPADWTPDNYNYASFRKRSNLGNPL